MGNKPEHQQLIELCWVQRKMGAELEESIHCAGVGATSVEGEAQSNQVTDTTINL